MNNTPENIVPLEEQIRERLCQEILKEFDVKYQNRSFNNLRTLVETYEVMFGKYVPEGPAFTAPTSKPQYRVGK